MRGLARRVAAAERRAAQRPCPACGPAGRTVRVVRGRERPPRADTPCPRCGRRPEVVVVRVTRVEGPVPGGGA